METPPAGNESLTYNGKPLSLLSGEGTSVGGTMQYCVGGKDSTEQPNETAEWKSSISDITAADAGTYTIWYRASGDADYATSDLGSITVSIGKATPTVTVQPVTGTYGEDITITAEVTVPDVDPSLVTGTVQFAAGSTTLGTANVENGSTTLTVPGTDRDKQHALFGTDGSSTVTAVYSGNDNIEGKNSSNTATISQRNLEYTVTAENKAFDGRSDIPVTLTPSNALTGDQVSLTAVGTVESPVAGEYSKVNLSNITLSGEDARYYTVETNKTDVELDAPVTITGDNTGSPQGRVTMDGEPVPNASVTIKEGGEVVATTETDSNGYYYFEDTAPGVYEVIVETEDKTMTSMVEYTEETGSGKNLAMPTEDVNSILDIVKTDSVIAVGGLDDVAQENAVADSTVTVTMTVENKTEANVDHAQAIETAAAGKELDYMSIELKKETKTGEEIEVEPLTETTQLLTIVLRFDFTNKDDVLVYRYHNSTVDTLTETENGNGEYIVLDAAGGTVTLHVKNFSTYAIGYTRTGEPAPSEPPVVPGPPIPTAPPTPIEPPRPVETPAPTEPPAATNPPIPVEPAPTYYDVTISSDIDGGTVTANHKSAQEGSKVTLTVTPNVGYHFVSLTVTDSKGNPVELTDNKDGTYTFQQPAGKVSVEVAFVKCSSLAFTDLDLDAWLGQTQSQVNV